MGMVQFIEVTDQTGATRIVSLSCICFILKDPRDGRAVLEFISKDVPRLTCKESYDEVKLALMHRQPELPRHSP